MRIDNQIKHCYWFDGKLITKLGRKVIDTIVKEHEIDKYPDLAIRLVWRKKVEVSHLYFMYKGSSKKLILVEILHQSFPVLER